MVSIELRTSVTLKGEYAEGKALYQKILKEKPRDINAYRILSLLLQQESKHEEAIALLDSAEVKVGQNPFLQAIKRQLLIGTNQIQRAIDELNESIEQMPYDPSNYIALGDIYDQSGADSLAERAFVMAYSLDSLSVEPLVSIANFYQRRGDKKRYLQYVSKIVDNDKFSETDKVTLVKELAQGVTKSGGRYDPEPITLIMSSLADQYAHNDEVQMIYLRQLAMTNKREMIIPELRKRVNKGNASINSYKLLINMLSQNKAIDSVKVYIDRALTEFPQGSILSL